MLKKLRLEGFQPHDQLEVSLGPLVSIVGPSDVGKSSLIRALRWVLFGPPAGDVVLRRGNRRVRVQVQIGPHQLGRQRNLKGESFWRFDGSNFEATGGKVPEAIAQELQLREEINLQLQLDPVFLFSLSGGAAAAELNRVVDLADIDRALQASGSQLRELKRNIQDSEQRIADWADEADGVRWIHKADEALAEIESELEQIHELERRQGQLARIIKSQKHAQKDVFVQTREFNVLGKIVKLAEEVEADKHRAYRLRKLIFEMGEALWQVHFKLPELPDVDRMEKLTAVVDDLVAAQKTILQSDELIAELEAELGEAKCPHCGQPMKPVCGACFEPI